jgi:lysosomal acid lipase/cholesteryl ester hydrolase
VFLQHGLNSSANTWINNGDASVSKYLVDAGFNVWLGNNRGSYYSRANTKIDPNSNPKQFFDYSFY